MKSTIDSQSMEVPCPHCGRKIKETLGRLKNSPHLTCIQCGKGFDVDAASLKKTIKAVEDKLAKFQRDIGKMFR